MNKNPHTAFYYLLFLLLAFVNISYSQPKVLWDSTYGGSNIDYGQEMAIISGGFIAVGRCGSNNGMVTAATDPDGSGNHGREDFWILKLDKSGKLIWQNSLGGQGDENASTVKPTSDGGYIMAGQLGVRHPGQSTAISATGDVGTPDADNSGIRGGSSDIWVVKVNAAGIMQWHNILGGSQIDIADNIIQTSDGGYIMVGYTYSNDLDISADVDGSGKHAGTTTTDLWVVKLRANGTVQWSNAMGGSGTEYSGSCLEVSNGYLIGATSNSNDGDLSLYPDVDGSPAHGSMDFWLLKLDFNGKIVWQNTIGGGADDRLVSSPGVLATSDGNYVLGGYTMSTNGDALTSTDIDGSKYHGGRDYWVVKVDPSGKIIWHNAIGTAGSSTSTAGFDEIQSMSITCDGGIILSGYSANTGISGDKTKANPNKNTCTWLVKINNAGQIEWDLPFASAGPLIEGPPITSAGSTIDHFVLNDVNGDYYVLTSSPNAPGANKKAPNRGGYDSWFVKIGFELTADFQFNQTCFGLATQFTDQSVITSAQPTVRYSWNFGDPASGASNTTTTINPSHLYTSPGTYTVTQILQQECKRDTMIKIVTITPPPTVTFPNYTLCNGSSINITANVNTPGGTYIWLPGNQTTSSITISPTANITYTLSYTDIAGCTNTSITTVTVNPVPVLSIISQNNVLCNGGNTGTITLNTTSGTAPFNYTWNNGQISSIATGLFANSYTATVTDFKGCSSSISTTITEPSALQTFIPASNNIICYGGSTGSALAAALGGTAPYLYSWSTNPAQTTPTASNLAAGTYSVMISDNNGCTAQKTVTLTEGAQITSTVTILSNPLCNGDATGSLSVSLNNGITPFSYSWNPVTNTTSIATGLVAGTYTVNIIDANGCTAQSSATITEPALLTLTLSSTPDHCQSGDGTVTINASGGITNYSYVWVPNVSTTSSVSGLHAGLYNVTVKDNNGCISSGSVTVVPISADTLSLTSLSNTKCNGGSDGSATLTLSGSSNGPYNFSWNTTPIQNSLTATGLSAGNYILTVIDGNNCKDTMHITIHEPAPLSATITSTSTLCFGDHTGTATAKIFGGTPGYSYNWQNSQSGQTATGLASGMYTVLVTDNNGCTLSSSVQVNDSPQLIVSITPSTPICVGQNAVLSSNVVGGTPVYNYNWSSGQNTPAITSSALSSNTIFSLTVTDHNGCSQVAINQVVVNSLPVVNFTSDQISGCKILCISFTNTSPIAQSQTWNFGDGNSSSQPNPQNCFTQSGSYNITLTVTDNNGCSNSLTQNNYITVHPDPVASFTATPQPTTILNPTIYFNSENTGITAYQWSFGDAIGSSSKQQNPSYTYSDTGYFAVRLVVVNEFGCMDTMEQTIRINPDFALYIPNAFTPNNDNNNDIFLPNGIGVEAEKYELSIYDRWGKKIFQTFSPNTGWDGKANHGNLTAQQDVYVWKLYVKDILGQNHHYQGHVTLLK